MGVLQRRRAGHGRRHRDRRGDREGGASRTGGASAAGGTTGTGGTSSTGGTQGTGGPSITGGTAEQVARRVPAVRGRWAQHGHGRCIEYRWRASERRHGRNRRVVVTGGRPATGTPRSTPLTWRRWMPGARIPPRTRELETTPAAFAMWIERAASFQRHGGWRHLQSELERRIQRHRARQHPLGTTPRPGAAARARTYRKNALPDRRLPGS